MEGFLVSFNRKDRTVGFNTSDCGPAVKMSGPFYSSTSEYLFAGLRAHYVSACHCLTSRTNCSGREKETAVK